MNWTLFEAGDDLASDPEREQSERESAADLALDLDSESSNAPESQCPDCGAVLEPDCCPHCQPWIPESWVGVLVPSDTELAQAEADALLESLPLTDGELRALHESHLDTRPYDGRCTVCCQSIEDDGEVGL